MASSVEKSFIVLTENDIPGAKLKEKKAITAHSVDQLKRWLECRGLPINGKKTDLVKRVEICLQSGNKDRIFNGVDRGKWYNKKRENVTNQTVQTNPSVPMFPITGWKKFPSKNIPKSFCYGTIYNHFIDSAVFQPINMSNEVNSNNNSSDDDCDSHFDTGKPLKKGRIYFKSGHVKNMSDCCTNCGHYCVKADVMSSYRVKRSFKVMIMLHKIEGSVLDSSCECVASSLGRCNHIAGLLFAIEDYINFFGSEVACTSKLCEWNVGRKEKMSSRIWEKKYNHKTDQKQKVTFTPIDTSSMDKHDVGNKLLSEFKEHGTQKRWNYLFDFYYADYILTDDRKRELMICVEELQKNLTFTFEQPSEVPNTSGQSNNENWFTIRSFFITASKCRDIYNFKHDNIGSLLYNIFWYPKMVKIKYTDHGLKHESAARNLYSNTFKRVVAETGFWINPKYKGLGCSPDGIVFDSINNSYGLLEIKCPFMLKDVLPHELDNLTKEQRQRFCSSLDENNHLQLKDNHQYYYQIQMSLAILELQWCDFVIWTHKGLHCERIYFDPDFWNKVYPKLSYFHKNILSPEYFEMRVPRELKPFILVL